MKKDLFIRGLDEDIHKKLALAADKQGVSLNSILKDAVDKWLVLDTKDIPKHELILYADDQSLSSLLKSIDYASKSDKLLRATSGPQDHLGVQFLKKQGWFDGSVEPYREFLAKPYNYASKVLEKVGTHLDGKSLFALVFLAGSLAKKKSLKSAVNFCQWYDHKQVAGNTFCLVNYNDVLNGTFDDVLEFFDTHGQVFVAKKGQLYKIHVSEESIHKLFLN